MSEFQEGRSTISEPPTTGGETIGILLLLLPLASAALIWFWVGNTDLREGSGYILQGIVVGTVVLSALLASMEASELGAGGPHDVDMMGKGRTGPIAWFLGTCLLWIVMYPAWLYKRSGYDRKNLLALGIIVMLVFFGSAYMTAVGSSNKGSANPYLQTTSTSSGGVSLAQYQRLTDDMTYADAVAILGSSGSELSRSSFGNVVTVMYSWPGSGGRGANMNAMFQNDRLITKAQFGLR